MGVDRRTTDASARADYPMGCGPESALQILPLGYWPYVVKAQKYDSYSWIQHFSLPFHAQSRPFSSHKRWNGVMSCGWTATVQLSLVLDCIRGRTMCNVL